MPSPFWSSVRTGSVESVLVLEMTREAPKVFEPAAFTVALTTLCMTLVSNPYQAAMTSPRPLPARAKLAGGVGGVIDCAPVGPGNDPPAGLREKLTLGPSAQPTTAPPLSSMVATGPWRFVVLSES